MYYKTLTLLFLVFSLVLLSSCTTAGGSPTPVADMPNPASVFCAENGGVVEMREDADGGVQGVCVFPDGSECDEWAFFRGECKPGDSLKQPTPPTSPPVSEPSPIASEEAAHANWAVYRNAELGYRFEYLADAEIIAAENPLGGIMVVGPVVDGESWPQWGISHPQDRAEFQVPEGADLLQWLEDHDLAGETRLADTQIAGTIAIHFRHNRTEQSYAFDRYYFVNSGQLYMILIGHTGDKEDWELYDTFLQSFQFEK
jgi:putative hemolysin